MDIYRIRIIHKDEQVSVLDYSFSQVCALIKNLSTNEKDKFWNKIAVNTEIGNLKFMRQV